MISYVGFFLYIVLNINTIEMGLIDFTKNYILRKGDLKEAKIGHVNHALEEIKKASANYKEYVVLLTQNGSSASDAPVATIISNTFDEVPTWVRDGAGTYSLHFQTEIAREKLVVTCNPYTLMMGNNFGEYIVAGWNGANSAYVTGSYITRSTGVIADPTDGLLYQHVFSLKLYN